ncbi:MAG: rhamnulokinase [Bacillales bacterium]|jgi:rhamnulokinase|nr:rhamnulokinase [Bacillales bacterium]
MIKCYLAVDIGASSGRTIVGYYQGSELVLKETHRFSNKVKKLESGLVWDIDNLYNQIIKGLSNAFKMGYEPLSLGIDTFGVDYALLDENNNLIGNVRAYRDERGSKARKEFIKKFSEKEQFNKTGIICLDFNTLYQLYDDYLNSKLEKAHSIVFLPNYLSYLLGAKLCNEFTIASTSGLLNNESKEYEKDYLDVLNIKREQLLELVEPNTLIGTLSNEVIEKVGFNCQIVAVSSHDTASAVYGNNIQDDTIFLSNGTWSLLGVLSLEAIKSEKAYEANFSNEGSINGVRFLKNIMGLWIYNCLRAELDPTADIVLLNEKILLSNYQGTFDVNDSSLFAPKSMKEAILELLKKNNVPLPQNNIDLYYAVFASLTLAYQKAIEELEIIVQRKYKTLTVFGGGIQNVVLKKLMLQNIKKEIIFGEIEATAIGNILSQVNYSKISR